MVELSHGVAADRNKMSLGASFVDRMSKKEQTDLQESFARAVYVYASGTPFSIVENSHWTTFFKQLRPAFQLPTRKMLSTSLLDEENTHVSESVQRELQSADGIAIVTDGWTSVNQTPIINFILTVPQPVFYRSVSTGIL